jgi:hypothetical protein
VGKVALPARIYKHNNPYIHELIRVPQTYFDFQTPDFWKGGDSAYAHTHATWDVRVFVSMNKAGAETAFRDREDSMFDILKTGSPSWHVLPRAWGSKERVGPWTSPGRKRGEVSGGGVVLNTKPYENWLEHWDKQKHPDRDTVTDDYVLNEFINSLEGIESTENDPMKGFREQDWVERAQVKNSKEFPLWALPELKGFSDEETEVLTEAENFRFGDRNMYEDEPYYGVKAMLACRPPHGALACLY